MCQRLYWQIGKTATMKKTISYSSSLASVAGSGAAFCHGLDAIGGLLTRRKKLLFQKGEALALEGEAKQR